MSTGEPSFPAGHGQARYLGHMAIAPDAAAIHQLVDQIQPADYGAVYVILRRLATNAPLSVDEADLAAGTSALEPGQLQPPRHRFSFTGVGEGPRDLSSRTKAYLRDSVRDDA